MGGLLLRLARGRDGSTTVESALSLPILVMFIVGTLELGRILWLYGALWNATQEAGRLAMTRAGQCGAGAAARFTAVMPHVPAIIVPTTQVQSGLTLCTLSTQLPVSIALGWLDMPITLRARITVPSP
ncbi:MAG TPA: TadE family protein [Azospirillaceae bacterium]|nr:TadE family protein [Azospirillaceae bacterium]